MANSTSCYNLLLSPSFEIEKRAEPSPSQSMMSNIQIASPKESGEPVSTECQINIIHLQTEKETHWLSYAAASFFFGTIGQFSMGFMSENIYSRFILSLGNLIFVLFYSFFKCCRFRSRYSRWPGVKDCAWCEETTGKMKPGTLKYLFLSIFSRFFYGFSIILALGYAKSNNMNMGIVLSVRSSEALFVALWTYVVLHERLSLAKLSGLLILTGGVVGLSLPQGNKYQGFSIWAIVWAIVSALVSALRNFTVKALTKQKVDGDTITLHAVFWADLITVIIGVICCVWGVGFNHKFYDRFFHEETYELSWKRFGMSIVVGIAIYFSLSMTANANQAGFAGIKF